MNNSTVDSPLLVPILGAVATIAIVALLPKSIVPASHARSTPTELRLEGTVRDFRPTHPDFDVPAIGHHVGTVGMTLDAKGRPVYVGNGYEVVTPWRDDASRPIPSHLYGDAATPRLAVKTRFRVETDCAVDSFDSRNGAYGGANVGSEATLSIDSTSPARVMLGGSALLKGNVLVGQGGNPLSVVDNEARVTGTLGTLPQPIDLPVIELPTDVGPYLGNEHFNGDTIYINSNRNWGDVRMEGTLIHIQGHVTVLVKSLDIDDTVNDFLFHPDSSLKLYCTDWMEVDDDARINMNTGDPSRLTIYMTGTYDGSGDEEEEGLLDVEDGAQINADIVAPQGKLLLENGCDIYGTFVGGEVEITANSRFHVDLAVFSTGCATGDGPPGAIGAAGGGGVTSAASFEDWFTSRMGVNLARPLEITLTDDGSGVFEYLDDDFHPIDDRLFGNEEMQPHNDFFTWALSASFEYTQCSSQFFEFEGGDGVWLFIDGELVMDLGGVDPGTPMYVDLDRLGLEGGETYDFQFFYAQRNRSSDVFRMRTNLELMSQPVTATSSAFD